MRLLFLSVLLFPLFLMVSCQAEYEQPLSEARQLMRAGKGKEAKPLIEKVLSQTDQSSEAYNLRGSLLFEEQAYDKALADFSAAIALQDRQYKYYLNRGHVYHAQKEYDKALDDYESALSLNANEHDIHLNKGIVLLKKNQEKQALAALNRAINLKKDNAQAFYYRALAQKRAERLAEATQDFQRALVLDDQLGKAHLELALALYKASPEDPPKTLCTHLNRAQTLGESRATEFIQAWCGK